MVSDRPDGGWEHFPHGADIGIRGWGRSLEAALEQAAMALTAIVTNPEEVRPKVRISVRCDAPDSGLLLADWLNALIYEMATRKMLFSRFRVDIREGALVGEAWSEPVEVSRHRPGSEPKGATFTGLAVSRRGDQWVAECVVDV